MRGKDVGLNTCGFDTGITPAYAGKSCVQQNHIIFLGDHPRVCGEKGKKG